jgi:hypothetical protein
MTSYYNPFTGQTISPSSVSYEALIISANTELSWPINGNSTTSTPVSSILDVTATVGSLLLELPPATQVSTGQSVLVRNIGSIAFTVTDNSGNTIVTVGSGISEFIFLTDNTTVDGVWTSVVFGAGTSSANASALAGYGLKAEGLTLETAVPLVSYFSNTTLSASNRAQFAVWSGGVGSMALPSAAAVGNNWFVVIRNSGTGILTLTPNGTNTIDGNVSQQLQLTESMVLVSNGATGYSTYAYGRSNQFAYTQLALNVTGGTLTLSSTQASNTIQEYAGALTSNQIIVVPSTVQLYTVTNNTTGTYTLTVKTAVVGGAAVVVDQGTSLVLICDGTNVYNAASGSASSITSLTVGNGSLAVPAIKFLGDLNSGIYLPASGTVGFVIGNAQVGYYASTGLTMAGTVTAIGGVLGGTF